MVKLAKNSGNVLKLKKPELFALLYICYGTKVDEKKHLKPIVADMLRDKIRENPEAVVVTPEIAAAAAATAAAAVAAAAAAAVAAAEVPIATDELVEGPHDIDCEDIDCESLLD